MKQDQDRKHVRIEKLLHSQARQITAATVTALQQQLTVMTKVLQTAAPHLAFKAEMPGQVESRRQSVKSEGRAPPKLAIAAMAIGDEDLSGDEETLALDDLVDDGYESAESEDEDVARKRAELRDRMAAAKQGKGKKGKKDKKGKEAWGSDEGEGDPSPTSQDDGVKKSMASVGGEAQVQALQQSRMKRRNTALLNNEDKMPPGRRFARKLVFHPKFEWVVSAILVLCSVVVGIEASEGMKRPKDDQPPGFRALDVIFNLCFAIELFLRFSADYVYFVSRQNPGIMWNLLDMTLVLFAVIEEIATIAQSTGGVFDTSVLRTLRLVRLVRVARIVRLVRFFGDLRVMVNALKTSFRALLWAILLMLLVMYMYGVTFMQLAKNHLQVYDDDGNSLQVYYGSMGRTIGTLFMTVSGGILWSDAVKPLATIGWAMEPLFATFVVFTVFCCLNIITGIFVDNAMSSKRTDAMVIARESAKERRRFITDVSELFSKLDVFDRGELARADFDRMLAKDAVQNLFRKLTIPLDGYGSAELWELFDTEGTGSVNEDEFANGVRQLQGNARSLDVLQLKKDTQEISRQLQSLIRRMPGLDVHGEW